MLPVCCILAPGLGTHMHICAAFLWLHAALTCVGAAHRLPQLKVLGHVRVVRQPPQANQVHALLLQGAPTRQGERPHTWWTTEGQRGAMLPALPPCARPAACAQTPHRSLRGRVPSACGMKQPGSSRASSVRRGRAAATPAASRSRFSSARTARLQGARPVKHTDVPSGLLQAV